MPSDKRLKLSAQPDGFGFLYGWAERDGQHVRLDVLEPHTLGIIRAMGFHSIGWAYAKGPQILGLNEIENEARIFAWEQAAA